MPPVADLVMFGALPPSACTPWQLSQPNVGLAQSWAPRVASPVGAPAPAAPAVAVAAPAEPATPPGAPAAPAPGAPAVAAGPSSVLPQAGRSAASAALNTQIVAKLCKVLKEKSFSEAETAWTGGGLGFETRGGSGDRF